MHRLFAGLLSVLLAVPQASPARRGCSAQTQRDLIDAQMARFPAEPVSAAACTSWGSRATAKKRVFAEEIKLAAQRVGENYGSSTRSVLLLNDRRDLTTWPLASQSSLRYALGEIARVMNRDEDVLFLALSSHGSRDATIDVSNDRHGAAGARRRARSRTCWTNPASSWQGDRGLGVLLRRVRPAAGRQSHHRDHGRREEPHLVRLLRTTRDLTYFGEAFYRDSLPRSTHLRAAFETAQQGNPPSARRTRSVRPSQPQGLLRAVDGGEAARIEQAMRRILRPDHGR